MSTQPGEAHPGMNYEIAEAIAPTWEARRPDIERISRPIKEWLLAELRPQPGETLLELAAGTGDTGFDAAELLGETGELISSDFSPTMLAGARRRAAERGIENVSFRVIDAERIELDDDSVDGVLCRLGYMLMADPGAALAETRRVLRAGGKLGLAVWGPPERNPFFTATVIGLVRNGHMSAPDPDQPGIFSLGDPERLRRLLARADFAVARVEEVPVRFELPSAEEYLQVVADTAGPVALVLRGLSVSDRDAVAVQASEAIEAFAVPGGGYEIPGVALCALAR